MNEVENEDLVFTLETIVDKFGEEMAPYALGLCQNLVCFTPGVLFDAVVSPMCFDKLCQSLGHDIHCSVSFDYLRLYWSSILLNS